MAFDNTFTGDATFSSQGIFIAKIYRYIVEDIQRCIGVGPNLNSSGRVSPHHRRTMKDQETVGNVMSLHLVKGCTSIVVSIDNCF